MRCPSVEVAVTYEVSCFCGKALRGQRQKTKQIVPCPSCGRKHFIFPNSPWLTSSMAVSRGQTVRVNLNHLLLAIVLGSSLAMVLLFFLVRPYLRRPEPLVSASATAPDCRSILAEGERQLRQGNVFLAVRELNAALEQRELYSDTLSREEHHRLVQLWRQADLLARLLDQPLEEVVLQAMQHRNEEEWRAKLEHYRGRSIIFDDVLRRDVQDRPVLASYVVRAGNIEARVALEDLTLLQKLPLEPPRRWLFGARLSDCRREEGGVWVLRFEPDSAVLLSDEIVASICCPLPLDEMLLALLKRQDEWLKH